jgi:hypothetical protein
MKLKNENYNVYVDDELFDESNREIIRINLQEGFIEFTYKKEHFPYWPSVDYGKITLEKINA